MLRQIVCTVWIKFNFAFVFRIKVTPHNGEVLTGGNSPRPLHDLQG